MSNTGEFYDHLTFPVTRSTGSSASMRAELDLIETGFNKLPPLAGNALRLVKIGASATDMTVSGLYETATNQLLYGTSASRTVYGAGRGLQLEASGPQASMSIFRNSADSNAPIIALGKSRGTTAGSNTLVQDGDLLGALVFIGADGTDAETPGAAIQAVVTGAPGVNDMPTALDFYTTADGSASASLRARLQPSGNLSIGSTLDTAALKLQVYGTSAGSVSALIATVNTSTTTGSGSGINFLAYTNATNITALGRVAAAAADTAGAGDLIFSTGATGGTLNERARIDSTGVLVVGATTRVSTEKILSAGDLRVHSSSGQTVFMSRDLLPTVQGNGLGTISWSARVDGTPTYFSGSAIMGLSDAAWGAGSSPGYLSLRTTPSGATTPVERILVDSAGLVGIGMRPASILDITQTQNASSIIQILNGSAGAGADARLQLTNGTNAAGLIMHGTAHATQANALRLFVNGANPIQFFTNGAERARFDSNGLGIGASSGGRLIEVHNGTRAVIKTQATASTGTDALAGLEFSSWDGASVSVGATLVHTYSLQSTDPSSVQLNVVRNAPFVLKTNNIERMRVTGAGDAGLGITPATKLHIAVTGSASATSLRISNDTDAGYGQIQFIGSTFATTSRQKMMELVTGDAASGIAFRAGSGGAEHARFDLNGRLVHNSVTAKTVKLLSSDYIHNVQSIGLTSPGLLAVRYPGAVASSAASLYLARSRGTTDGDMTIVAASDVLGYLSFGGSDGTSFQEAGRIIGRVDGTPSAGVMPGRIEIQPTPAASATPATTFRFDASGDAVSVAAAGAIGYTTGAGGAVTQLTSKSTGVTLNRPSGQITMNGAALAANTAVGFTLTNSVIGTTDVVQVAIDSGATADAYHAQVDAVGAGSCRISIRNMTAGSLSEAIVLNFVVLRAATA